jgi:hypothetical protein
VDRAANILTRWTEQGVSPASVIGDGTESARDAIAARPDLRIRPTPRLAGAIGRMAVGAARRGETIAPAAIQPLYVRRPDAEVARDRRA